MRATRLGTAVALALLLSGCGRVVVGKALPASTAPADPAAIGRMLPLAAACTFLPSADAEQVVGAPLTKPLTNGRMKTCEFEAGGLKITYGVLSQGPESLDKGEPIGGYPTWEARLGSTRCSAVVGLYPESSGIRGTSLYAMVDGNDMERQCEVARAVAYGAVIRLPAAQWR